MSRDILPPSPFGAGTTYNGHNKHIIAPEATEQTVPLPRISRIAMGGAAMHEVTEPIRIVRSTVERPEDERRNYLEEVFRFPDPKAKDSYGRSLSERTRTTPESEADAAYAYRFADQDIKDIIAPYKTDQYYREEDMSALLRSNDELRMALGLHLLDKFKTIPQLPSRVALNTTNNLKSPNHPGYPGKMLSADYAGLLALSMLDGTYRQRKVDGDTSQHRDAAQMGLGIYYRLKSDRAWNQAQELYNK